MNDIVETKRDDKESNRQEVVESHDHPHPEEKQHIKERRMQIT